MRADEDCLAIAEERARARYREPGRFYHDENHLDDCLRQLGQLSGFSAYEHRLLRWAILWHDSVYEPTRTDNEERSADLAWRELSACGVPREDADEVARLILLTRDHHADPDDRLGAILVSIDLSILGSSPDRYRRYADAIRREYAHLPDEAFRAGRAALLKHMLATEPLFPDAHFARALELQARRNIADEISRLLSS